ncbi:hypothetical protein AMS68_006400 [Peltaster fructicola]|uniref:palmitoyl-protein hydrolase n=1 Tax=Peltaster fructicola TaxID=286661 RepID=A0A6H0Y1K5_9PEZI|nr:hypothetical protein AMS68_006400 [Peltaster fructicola]
MSKPLPLLLWHGLGDRFDNEGLQSVGDLAEQAWPGTQVQIISLGTDGDEDRKATFFGNVSEQIDHVCAGLFSNTSLADPSTGKIRADALGFSQGGQFLRGLLERCDNLSIRSLITFGSQHNGINEFSKCGQWDFLCKGALGLVKGNAWGHWVQGNVVPAQYYRRADPETGLGTAEYLEASHFLADINNEKILKNKVYSNRLASLESFVMYVFNNDTTVIPKESGWFAEVNETSGEVTPLQERALYKEDWLGLKKLDKKGGLVFRSHPGGHMRLEEDRLLEAFKEFYGPERSGSAVSTSRIQKVLNALRQIVIST